jgi:Crp-like helix-turn-helix domain
MNQELIASMLGVRREGLTEAAGKLQKLGVITYRRGRITVLDRRGLEQLSRECDAVPSNQWSRNVLTPVLGRSLRGASDY